MWRKSNTEFHFLQNISASSLNGGLDMTLTSHLHLVSRIRVIRAMLPVLHIPPWHAQGQLLLFSYSNVYGRARKPCNFLRVHYDGNVVQIVKRVSTSGVRCSVLQNEYDTNSQQWCVPGIPKGLTLKSSHSPLHASVWFSVTLGSFVTSFYMHLVLCSSNVYHNSRS
jgi:hypothetical protein